jgi:hypothetical protein
VVGESTFYKPPTACPSRQPKQPRKEGTNKPNGALRGDGEGNKKKIYVSIKFQIVNLGFPNIRLILGSQPNSWLLHFRWGCRIHSHGEHGLNETPVLSLGMLFGGGTGGWRRGIGGWRQEVGDGRIETGEWRMENGERLT